jgi:hypothetical protein
LAYSYYQFSYLREKSIKAKEIDGEKGEKEKEKQK